MIEFTQWCTLFCNGTEAVGDIVLDWPNGGSLALPICESCLSVVKNHPEKLLDFTPGPVLDLDAEEEARGLIPRE